MKIPEHVCPQLTNLKLDNRYRQLSHVEGIDFISNDYLGLAHRTEKIESSFGASGARLLSGNSKEHVELEHFFGQWYQAAALLYNSGYTANIGILSTLPTRHAVIFYDEEIHASCKDGLRLSLAKSVSFRHQDLAHLIEKIKLFPAKERYILVESVYSMSGDVCPIHEIAEICRKENIYLIVDEAHSFGIFGEQGKGLAYPFAEVCVAIIIPLGKAAGSYGALVVCSEEIKNYLINFSRPWIFSTAIPPALAEISLKHVKEVIKMDDLRKKLFDNIRIFDSHSPIVSIPCAGNDEVKKLSLYLAEKGFAQKPILSPTVPIGKERIRIVLHAFNTTDEVLRLREHLSY